MAQRKAVIVGGGFAGITAALALHDAGRQVTLLEQGPYLGGRCSGLDDPTQSIDVGHHMLFRGCSTTLRALGRLGLNEAVRLQPSTALWFARTEDGATAALRSGRLEAPHHLVGSMLAFPFLDLKDKVRMRRVVQAMRDADDASVEDLDEVDFGTWLRSFEQTERAIEAFWAPLVKAGLNVHPDGASTAQAVLLFRATLFEDAQAYDAATFTMPLGHMMREIEARLNSEGLEVRTSVDVTAVHRHDGAWHISSSGSDVMADDVVLAVGARASAELAGASPDLKKHLVSLTGLKRSPRVAIHLFYSTSWPAMQPPFVFLVGPSPIDLIVHRSAELEAPDAGQWISVLCNDASGAASMSDDALTEEAMATIDRIWPREGTESPARVEVVRSMDATFASRPGAVTLRKGLMLNKEGMVFAGDWMWTGWPSSIEGACRSGLQAATDLIDDVGARPWDAWPAAPRRGDSGWPVWNVTAAQRP